MGTPGPPEAAGTTIFEAPARLGTEREAGGGPPLNARSCAPQRAELLAGGVAGEPDVDAEQRVGTERGAVAERLKLVTESVEGPVATQTVVNQDRDAEAVRERLSTGQRRAGANLVARGVVAVQPAAVMGLQGAALGCECGGQEGGHQGRSPQGGSPPPQSQAAPRGRGVPFGGGEGAGAGGWHGTTPRGLPSPPKRGRPP